MTTLLVGFDSAWTATNTGAIVGLLRSETGEYRELGPPTVADFRQAEARILEWQAQYQPTSTIILLDQPTIVANPTGQRPVEYLVSSSVGYRHGGMQPTNTGKIAMFGNGAAVWNFLKRFGGAANPLGPQALDAVFETYPVLVLIALGWTLPDARDTGRLPKYNPARRKTFARADWEFVCQRLSGELQQRGLTALARWLNVAQGIEKPRKPDQDAVDACLCLLVALYLAEGSQCLMVGDTTSGYIVVPDGADLEVELSARCKGTGRESSEWVRGFHLISKRNLALSSGSPSSHCHTCERLPKPHRSLG